RHSVKANGVLSAALLLIKLAKMIPDIAVLVEFPGGSQKFFSLRKVRFGEIHPAQRVPVSCQRTGGGEVARIQLVEADVSRSRNRGRDRRFGILLCAIQMR